MFQSRNRDSFNFKHLATVFLNKCIICFNLAIEILLISRITVSSVKYVGFKFQSRNRDSFDFKIGPPLQVGIVDHQSFNLAIEILLISSR